jgi:putative YpdA family bacillithiol system oxidoreductase
MEHLYTYTIFLVLLGVLAVPYWIRSAKHRRETEEKFRKYSKGGLLTPVTLHPHIDLSNCIGCGNCVRICPENVLGIVDGRASIINGLKCVGHGLCEDVCPVQAITLGFGAPKQGMEIPYYDDNYQTNVEGMYVVGELGGIGLIRNAVNQSLKAVEHLSLRKQTPTNDFDAVIVGAGPAGLSAALSLHAKKLRYLVLEQDSIGGTIFHYPRQKLVLTSPVELPLHGTIKASEISKEALLEIWQRIVSNYKLHILTNHKVEAIERNPNGFYVKAGGKQWTSSNVLLAIGRRGSPRKLGVKGEDLPKVAYRLIETKNYERKNILVVGGGDSAIEAAVGLASQVGNTVTLSYRREGFVRVKEKNEQRINEMIQSKKIHVLFNSNVEEITADSVVLAAQGGVKSELPNDFVFIFAGGELPTELLKKAGVRLRGTELESKAA